MTKTRLSCTGGCLLYLLFYHLSFAQISPPGLGRAKAASWFALALRQDLDSAENWQSVTYLGCGRKSDPAGTNPFEHPSIWVANQEFYHKFNRNWQYSFALSYRRQNQYDESGGKLLDASPAYEHETRIYGRLSRTFKWERFKLVPTLRQEFRKFYEPGFIESNERLQFRTRFRLQLTAYLTGNKVHRLVASAEVLGSASVYHENAPQTGFKYREARFNVYYSIDLPGAPLTLNLGYMNNLVGANHPYDVHYLAFDVIFEDLFPLKHDRKKPVVENLE